MPGAALLSLVVVVLLGVALDRVLGAHLEREAIRADGDVATFLAQGIERGGEPRRLVRSFLAYDHRAADHAAARVWDARGRAIAGFATRPAPAAAFTAALRGRTTSERVPGRPELLHVVPLRDRRTGRPAGAVEVVQRAAAFDRDLARMHGALTVLIAGSFALLWLTLVPTALVASRRLARQAAAAERRARHDDLTGLLNRAGLVERLAATPAPCGVGVLDLEGFRALNAIHGAPAGDDVLTRAAAVLTEAVEPGATVARVGADEFAVLLPGAGPQRTHDTLAHLVAVLAAAPGEGVPGLRADAGHASAPADDENPHALLTRAAAALVAAKADPGHRVRRFRPADALAARPHEDQRAEVEHLLAHPDALTIVTQPVVAVTDGRVRGFEALARIDTLPRRGPDAWFEQARRVGLGAELEALAARKALELAPLRPANTVFAINLSPGAIVTAAVQAVLPADLSGVIVEVTEHELAADVDGLPEALADLRARGAGLAVDDAGAGYAGLTQTVALAPDAIKLDRALIAGIDADPAKAALVEAFVSFARRTGARLCAEGVETLDELRTLAWLDVDRAQGYGLARPAPGFPEVAPAAVELCRTVTADALGGDDRAPSALRRGVHHLADLGERLLTARSPEALGALTADLAAGLQADEVVLSSLDAGLALVRTLTPVRGTARPPVLALHDFPAARAALAAGQAAQVLLDDAGIDPHHRALLARTPYRSVLLVPVAWRCRTVGVLEVYLREQRAFTRSEISRSRVVAFHLGPVLDAVTDPAPRSTLIAA